MRRLSFAQRVTASVGTFVALTIAVGFIWNASLDRDILWKWKSEDWLCSLPVTDGLVFVEKTQHSYLPKTFFSAVGASTGKVRWEVPEDPAATDGGPTMASSSRAIFLINQNNLDYSVQAIRTTDGKKLWERPEPWVNGVAYGNGALYIDTDTIQAVDPATGAIKWTFPAHVTLASVGQYVCPASFAVDSGRIYYKTADNYSDAHYHATVIRVLDASTGRPLWSTTNSTGTADPFSGATYLSEGGGVVMGQNADGSVYALDGQTGRRRWRFYKPNNPLSFFVADPDGIAIVGGKGGPGIWALSEKTGEVLWSKSPWYVTEGTPVLGANHRLYIINNTFDQNRTTSILVLDDRTGSELGNAIMNDDLLDLFDIGYQFSKGMYDHPDFTDPLIGSDGTIYITSGWGRTYALRNPVKT